MLDALVAALQVVDEDRATLYHDIVCAALPEAARRYLEGLMGRTPYKFRSEFALTHIAKGKAEGKADAVLTVLDARGIEVPDDYRRQIAGCTDPELADAWVRRAITAESLQEIFAD